MAQATTTHNGHVHRSSQSGGGWTETTLGEMINVSSGKSRPKNKGFFPVYGGNGVLDYADNFNFDSETIIVGRVGAYCGCVYFEENKFWLSDNALGIKANEKSDIKFLYYFLINQNLNKKAIGGAQPLLTQGILNGIEVIFPPLPEQRAIASVLSAFDDKIELLREQNKTLEETAQAIFKEWFIKGSWQVQRLGDLVEVKRGGSPRPIQDYISKSGLRWLKISDASATASPYIFEIKEYIKKEGLKKTTLLKIGSLVLSNSATPGIPKILAVDSCIHDGWLHFPKSKFSNEFLYLLFQEIRPQLVQQGSGSVFTNLKTDILKDYEAPLPDDKTLQRFDCVIKPVFEKIFNNASQIQTLSTLRDTLLPKLMKGEIRVKT